MPRPGWTKADIEQQRRRNDLMRCLLRAPLLWVLRKHQKIEVSKRAVFGGPFAPMRLIVLNSRLMGLKNRLPLAFQAAQAEQTHSLKWPK